MGVLLGEWRSANAKAVRFMRLGILTLVSAMVIIAASTRVGA